MATRSHASCDMSVQLSCPPSVWLSGVSCCGDSSMPGSIYRAGVAAGRIIGSEFVPGFDRLIEY